MTRNNYSSSLVLKESRVAKKLNSEKHEEAKKLLSDRIDEVSEKVNVFSKDFDSEGKKLSSDVNLHQSDIRNLKKQITEIFAKFEAMKNESEPMLKLKPLIYYDDVPDPSKPPTVHRALFYCDNVPDGHLEHLGKIPKATGFPNEFANPKVPHLNGGAGNGTSAEASIAVQREILDLRREITDIIAVSYSKNVNSICANLIGYGL